MHLGLAVVTKTPELQLTEPQSKEIAKAVGNVARHYDGLQVDDKVIDWGYLIITLLTCYGGKVAKINERKKAEKAKDITPKNVSENKNNDTFEEAMNYASSPIYAPDNIQ